MFTIDIFVFPWNVIQKPPSSFCSRGVTKIQRRSKARPTTADAKQKGRITTMEIKEGIIVFVVVVVVKEARAKETPAEMWTKITTAPIVAFVLLVRSRLISFFYLLCAFSPSCHVCPAVSWSVGRRSVRPFTSLAPCSFTLSASYLSLEAMNHDVYTVCD